MCTTSYFLLKLADIPVHRPVNLITHVFLEWYTYDTAM